MSLVLIAIAMIALSGVPALICGRQSLVGQQIAVYVASAGALVGIAGTAHSLSTGGDVQFVRPWMLPEAEFRVGLDGISAFFLLPIFLVSMLGSVYGLDYSSSPATDASCNGFLA